MARHLGDYDASTVIYGKFTTYRPSTGATFTLGGTPALSVYKDNSTTQSTTGVTLTADFDSVTGLNHFAIDTSADGTFYAAGSFFDIVITTGTVDSVSVTGAVVASFTLRKDSSLKPTTAARTLDVSADGEAGVDWANVGSPTTTVGLSGTTVKTATDIATLIGTPAGASVSADILTIDNLVDDLESRVGTPSNLGGGATLSANLSDIEAQTDDIGVAGAGLTAVPWNATWDAEVQSEVDDALVAQRLDELLNADSDIDGAAPPTVGSVFHELMTKTAGSFTFDQTTDSLEAVRDRGDAAWITATGFSTLDAAGIRTAVGLASANLDTQLSTIDDFLDTEVAAIKAKTDLIPGTVDGKTFIQGWTLMLAVLLGKASGLATTTAIYRAVDDSKDRVTATVDADGNRTALTLDAS